MVKWYNFSRCRKKNLATLLDSHSVPNCKRISLFYKPICASRLDNLSRNRDLFPEKPDGLCFSRYVWGDALEIYVTIGVARWYFFRPKIAIWVNFGGSFNGRCLSILWPFDIFYAHLVYFDEIWYIFPRLGILYQEKSGIPGYDATPYFPIYVGT
jgi:hypothetical protein